MMFKDCIQTSICVLVQLVTSGTGDKVNYVSQHLFTIVRTSKVLYMFTETVFFFPGISAACERRRELEP